MTSCPRARTVAVMVLGFMLGCSSSGEVGGEGTSADGGATDGGGGGTADAAPEVAACSEPQQGPLALEFTYDAPPDVTGGTIELQGAEIWSLTEPDGSGRVGAHGVRSELRYGDTEAYGGARAETAVVGGSTSRYATGDSVFYGFSVHLPAGWVDDGSVEDILFEWHDISDEGEAGKAPNLVLTVVGDDFHARITSDASATSTPDTETVEEAVLVDGLETTQGTWYDFVFHVVWSYEGQDGLIEAWHKRADANSYRKVLEKRGPNQHNDELEGYVKWGINKPAWKSGPTAASVRVLMHDEIRVGESFGAVEPACTR